MAAPSEHIEFDLDDRGAVLDRMRSMLEERNGWINVEPRPSPGAESPPATSSLFGFLAALGPDIPLITWMPQRPKQAAKALVSVGIQHPAGPKVVRHLAELGIEVPKGWVVRQDHPRRGLVLELSADEPVEDVMEWLVVATRALCAVPLGGRWLAVVYLTR